MTSAAWRKLIAAVLVIVIGLAAAFSIRWIWRDITYWSRSVTVAYETATLSDCVKLAFAAQPEVSASSADGMFKLQIPDQEGALVKDTPDPQVARIVIYGHSESVSHLGPASEEPVTALLRELKGRMTMHCGESQMDEDAEARKSVN